MTTDTETLIEFVTNSYLSNQEALSAKQIAQGLNWSANKVSKILKDGVTHELSCSNAYRQSYSKDYPSFQAGVHRVTVWEPSKWHLVNLINRQNNI